MCYNIVGGTHIFIDGASKGNPGAAGIGEGTERATSNVAEYKAPIRSTRNPASALGLYLCVVFIFSCLIFLCTLP